MKPTNHPYQDGLSKKKHHARPKKKQPSKKKTTTIVIKPEFYCRHRNTINPTATVNQLYEQTTVHVFWSVINNKKKELFFQKDFENNFPRRVGCAICSSQLSRRAFTLLACLPNWLFSCRWLTFFVYEIRLYSFCATMWWCTVAYIISETLTGLLTLSTFVTHNNNILGREYKRTTWKLPWRNGCLPQITIARMQQHICACWCFRIA